MATLIDDTGEHPAIKLRAFSFADIERMELRATQLQASNGGFADFLLEMRHGVFQFLHINESIKLGGKKSVA